jgi:hypothetical protein
MVLGSGYNNHRTAGYAYFIYDANRFAQTAAAEAAVSRWLDRKHAAAA